MTGNSPSPPKLLGLIMIGFASVVVFVTFVLHTELEWMDQFSGGLTSAAPQSETVDASPGVPSSSSSLPFDPSSFPDPDRLCSQNQYAKSLSLPLEEYRRLGKEWMDSKVEIEKKLLDPGHKHSHDRFGAFQKMGSCVTTCIGGPCRKDVSKIACGADRDTTEAPCVVYSVGGNNQWEFELDVLAKTPCDVHTFDCTGKEARFKVPTEHGDRLKFHYVCLGTKNKDATGTTGEFWTLEKMQKTLGHDQIDLFKMYAEGYEFPLFDSWPILTDVRSPAAVLPMQILVEVHYQTQMPELSRFRREDWKFSTDMINLQSKFLQMGYAVIERDDNRRCAHCTELTLVRVRCPPTPRLGSNSTTTID